MDRYSIDCLHATAGYSCVYQARDPRTDQIVALKVLHQGLARSSRHVECFKRESEALGSIRHPNVVDLIGCGTLDDGRPYFVMEWCAGATLETLLARTCFTLAEAMPIFRQLVAALEAVHAAGVIHRDIKSANVILVPTADDAPLLKLVDFGISTTASSAEAQRTDLTSTGARLGTPYYMAPEQIYGLDLDLRTDVYALGVLCFEVLTGHKPFPGIAIAEVIDQQLHLPPPCASTRAPLPEAIDLVLQRCMAKNKQDRYASVAAVLVDLEAAADAQPMSTRGNQSFTEAVGVHIDLDFCRSKRDVDDEDYHLLEELLGYAQAACTDVGLQMTLETSNGFLAVGLLRHESTRGRELRKALELARRVTTRYQELDSAGISLSIVMHIGKVKVESRDGVVSLIGGDLLSISEWSHVADEALVIATTQSLRSLDLDCEHVPGRPGYVRIKTFAPLADRLDANV